MARSVSKGSEIQGEELSVTCKDGIKRIVRISASAMADGLIVSFIDLTELRSAERRLGLWSESFERARLGIVIVDAQTNVVVAVNPAFAEDRGYGREEMAGLRIRDLFPDDRANDARAIIATLDATSHGTFESEHLTKDGRRFPVLLDITALRDETGRPMNRIAFVLNLTEQKRAAQDLQEARDAVMEQRERARIEALEHLRVAEAARREAETALAALQESEARLKLFIEHAPAALAMFDRDMQYLAVSRRWLDDYALGDRVLLGQSHYEVFPEIGEAWKDAHRRGLAGEVVSSDEDLFQRADGRAQWIRWEIRPWQAASGAVGGIVIFTEDITRYKEAETRQRLLADVLRALRNINQLITREKNLKSLLRRACELLTATRGYRTAWIAQLTADGTLRAAAESGLGAEFRSLEAYLEKGEVPVCCERALRDISIIVESDVSESCGDCPLLEPNRDMATLVGPIAHEDHTYGVLVVGLPKAMAEDPEEQSLFREIVGDIGFALYAIEIEQERVLAAEALRVSEERFRRLAENAQDLIFRYELLPSRRYAYVSPSAQPITGYEVEDYYADPDFDSKLLYPEDRDAFRAAIEGTATHPQPFTQRWIKADGAIIWMEQSMTAIRDEAGTLLAVEVIARDVTERKIAEIRISDNLKEKETLLRELYHRTRNNMHTIISFMSIQSSHHPDTALPDFVDDISQRITAMSLIHDRLYQQKNLSRIDLGEYLADLGHHAIANYAQGKRINLRLALKSITVLLDTALPIGLVVNELLMNALQHAFPGDRGGEVKLLLSETDGMIELCVSDDGVGLPGDFDLSSQSFIGLKTVYSLVEDQLKGTISLERGSGTTYTIRFRDDAYTERVK